MQPQPTPDVEASRSEAGERKTESCLSTALLWHSGQMIFSRADRTIVSKRCLHLQHWYSNIGMAFVPV